MPWANEQAARLSGIRTENVKWFAYRFAPSRQPAGAYIAESGAKPPHWPAATSSMPSLPRSSAVAACREAWNCRGTLLGAIFLRAVSMPSPELSNAVGHHEGMIVGMVVVAAVTFSQLVQIRTWSAAFRA
jgi:hypothetical protein